MSSEEQKRYIVATDEAKTLPVEELLTGRGFITGKSGGGKSNTMSVIIEELLDGDYNLLIVDTDGEYYGLKEKYELLHVGGDDRCDVKVEARHAEKIAEVALCHDLPVILDVSGYLEADEAEDLVEGVVRNLFAMENELRKPFLLVVEEMQEYLPQTGGTDDLSDLLIRVAKRGRKRGLGLCGLSQRPSAVDKDFITQCDWMVWHRLTWDTDIDRAKGILGDDRGQKIPDLETGEGYLMTDWDEQIELVQFREKKTFDAGDTPGIDDSEYRRPELKSIDPDLISELMGDVEGIEIHSSSGFGESSDSTVGSVDTGSDEETEVGEIEEVSSPSIEDAYNDERDSEEGSDEVRPADVNDLVDVDELNLLQGDQDSTTPQTDDPEELRKMLAEERRRNEILEDEVRELKQIIENVENGGGNESEGTVESQRSVDASELLEEDSPEGPAGVVVEAGLLVWYLSLRLTKSLKRGYRTLRSTPVASRSKKSAYPISTRNPSRNESYPSLEGNQVAAFGLLVLLALVIGFGIWLVVPMVF